MPSQVSDQELGEAILQTVQHNTFPQSEHVASAAVPSTALPVLLEVVGKAREDAKVGFLSKQLQIASPNSISY